jgi:hypothetical protein
MPCRPNTTTPVIHDAMWPVCSLCSWGWRRPALSPSTKHGPRNVLRRLPPGFLSGTRVRVQSRYLHICMAVRPTKDPCSIDDSDLLLADPSFAAAFGDASCSIPPPPPPRSVVTTEVGGAAVGVFLGNFHLSDQSHSASKSSHFGEDMTSHRVSSWGPTLWSGESFALGRLGRAFGAIFATRKNGPAHSSGPARCWWWTPKEQRVRIGCLYSHQLSQEASLGSDKPRCWCRWKIGRKGSVSTRFAQQARITERLSRITTASPDDSATPFRAARPSPA